MKPVINICNIKINNISNNGSFNIGEVVHSNHTANTKSQGSNSSFGDASPPQSGMENVFIDPDMNDMNEVGNPTSMNSTQI